MYLVNQSIHGHCQYCYSRGVHINLITTLNAPNWSVFKKKIFYFPSMVMSYFEVSGSGLWI